MLGNLIPVNMFTDCIGLARGCGRCVGCRCTP